MKYRRKQEAMYSVAEKIYVTILPQQRWKLERTVKDGVFMYRDNVSVFISNKEFKERWVEVQ